MPRTEALRVQRESQILFLLGWDGEGGEGILTGKLFDYLGARRPILAMGGPGGEMERLLRETGAGVFCSSPETAAEFLENSIRDWRADGKVPYGGREQEIMKYSHREMARRFAGIFDSLMGPRS